MAQLLFTTHDQAGCCNPGFSLLEDSSKHYELQENNGGASSPIR